MIFRAGESETLEHLRRERTLTPEGCFVRSDSMWSVLRRCWALEQSKPVSTPLAASDRNELVSGEPRRDKETSSLCYGVVGALLYMGHDTSDACNSSLGL